ncbi:hypothetical protein [Streptomyces pacificus]|uniref:Uncharacterized protein n=1 Tax=Streptomyces pacificus TaxID=2705029 RepID=A0A6A0AX22_9ACTN|nr:hypothetical protein [Streptomyces pacificus]GFH37188.1 hypothetical protein SCWH03_34240 [Streptomyces pacificus]
MQYALGLLFALGSAFMTWQCVRLWKDPSLVGHFMNTFAFMPFGKEVKRGEVRSLALTSGSLWGITVLLFMGLTDVDMSGAWTVVFVIALVTVLGALACEVCVVLFNAPKFVVPPHMRSDLGSIATHRKKRREQR